MRHRFFSFIVPAYNEEKVIEDTLGHLVAIEYPQNRYEIIVVENGSTDRTFEVAQTYASEHCHVYQSAKGVSHARNVGLAKRSPEAEWTIAMDADTFVRKNFLNELNTYLDAHPEVSFGTTEITFDDYSRTGRFWSWYTNVTDRALKMLHRLHIVRVDLLSRVTYDERLVSGEDLHYSRDLAKIGKYFFMPTTQVISSARRYVQKGYIKMFFLNMRSGLPRFILKHTDWEVVR